MYKHVGADASIVNLSIAAGEWPISGSGYFALAARDYGTIYTGAWVSLRAMLMCYEEQHVQLVCNRTRGGSSNCV
jgi:molybdenum-dependent DNA-binding transcriptional regulator ModE